ncbi:MAG TPA: hypothetical protein VFD82_06480 [Planctomycetota bacterium]|nr:hypothetical protein [Planctomycetota bacterium]
MLPYPTDQRRLLMMVRVFLHEISEFVAAHADGMEYPSDPNDKCADHQLEAFLERLAEDARQIDCVYRTMTGREESEAEVHHSLASHLRALAQQVPWHHNRLRLN